MNKLVKSLINTLSVLFLLYVLFCMLLYFQQEKLIFNPSKLPKDYIFRFDGRFEERFIPTADGHQLHGLLFKTNRLDTASQSSRRKVIFFLHGNAGSLDSWGTLAPYYTQLGYDIFMLDYRGYGKSEGSIENESQFFGDVQAAYQHISTEYREEDIVIVGFSIGSGPAAMLTARNSPRMLLLLAPYYSLTDMVRRTFPFVPPFLLKYKFSTWTYLEQTKAPVYIFHGNRDEVIPYASSVKLKKHLKPVDQHITLEGVSHNAIHESRQYQAALRELLAPAR